MQSPPAWGMGFSFPANNAGQPGAAGGAPQGPPNMNAGSRSHLRGHKVSNSIDLGFSSRHNNASSSRPTSLQPPPHQQQPQQSQQQQQQQPQQQQDNYTDLALLQDIPSWLKSLRLHKYTDCLKDLSWQELVALSDAELDARGVNALGARRKMLKVFEQVRDAQKAGTLP